MNHQAIEAARAQQSFNSTSVLTNAMSRLYSRDRMEDDEQHPQQAAAASSSLSHPQQQQPQQQQQLPQQQQHAAASSSPQIPSKRDQSIDESDEEKREMAKLRPIIGLLRQIKELIDQVPVLSNKTLPCVSASQSKDRVPTGCTAKGYAEKQHSLELKLGTVNAEVLRMAQAVQNYSVKLNDACELKYAAHVYRSELRALEATRNQELDERTEAAALLQQQKKESIKGFERRFNLKESHKRKKLGTDETKKPSIFDL